MVINHNQLHSYSTTVNSYPFRCSYLMLLRQCNHLKWNRYSNAGMRFVSHAWLEPVCKFVACLKHHASLRELSEQTAYWVCAYANNQHQLQAEICHNPRKTSFYRAIKSCAGVLLVLDQNATPFTRNLGTNCSS